MLNDHNKYQINAETIHLFWDTFYINGTNYPINVKSHMCRGITLKHTQTHTPKHVELLDCVPTWAAEFMKRESPNSGDQ